MKKKDKNSGIVLISTLFTLIFIFIIATTVLITSKQAIRWSGSYKHRQLAINAAMSGMAYAKMRIQEYDAYGGLWQGAHTEDPEKENPGYAAEWKNPKISSTSGFTVVEHFRGGGKGWVEGTMSGDGPVSKFFIYFAAPPSTKFNDKDVGIVTAKYLSLNNSNSFDEATNYFVDGTTEYKKVPYYTSHIIVQGQCAGASRHVEVMMLKLPNKNYDSVGISNNDFIIRLIDFPSRVWNVSAEMGLPALIRSKGNLSVSSEDSTNQPYTGFVQFNNGRAKVEGEVTVDPKYEEPVNLGLIGNQKDIKRHIPNLTFQEDNQTDPQNLPAGEYEFTKDLDDNILVKYTVNGVTTPYSLLAGARNEIEPKDDLHQTLMKIFSFGKSKISDTEVEYKILINEPIRVLSKDTGNDIFKDFTIQSDSTIQLSLNMNSTEDKPIYISSDAGDINIKGELVGEGSVHSGGNISFQGRSQLSSDSGIVCVYAGGDIELLNLTGYPEENPNGNPSEYIAKATEMYLDEPKFKIDGENCKNLERSDKEFDKILKEKPNLPGYPDTQNKELKHILEQKEFKFEYDKTKQYELVDELLRNNNDGVSERRQGKGSKTYYKFNTTSDRYKKRFQGIYEPNQPPPLSARERGKKIEYKDIILKGVIYAIGNFTADIDPNKLTIQGSLISKEGDIIVEAGNVTFLYDPRYLGALYELKNFSYRQLYWAVH